MSIDYLELAWTVLRRLTNDISARTLYLRFDEHTGNIAKDSSGYDYDADYNGTQTNLKWTKSSVKMTDDFFHIPAAPFNFSGDFSFSVWVKSLQTEFTILSCRRHDGVALEITNKRVTVNGVSYNYSS